VDHLGLEEAVGGFGERVVIAVADAPDRGLDAGFGEAFGIYDRDILAATVAVMDEAAFPYRPPVVQRLLERVEDESRVRGAAHPPADDPPGEDVDDEGDVYEPAQVAT